MPGYANPGFDTLALHAGELAVVHDDQRADVLLRHDI